MPSFDIIFVLPYLFSDHPSFPEGILRKALESEGFRVGVIDQPFWQDKEAFMVLGKPELFFAVISGPVDSVVLNYTSLRKRRREDLYQLRGKAYFEGYPPSIKYKIRPDRVVNVFANRIRECFRDAVVVIGGVEASLRRFAHYDFQQDRIRRSILLDSRADILVTGMGEKQLVQIAQALQEGQSVQSLRLAGTLKIGKEPPEEKEFSELPALEDILKENTRLLDAHLIVERAGIRGEGLFQRQGDQYVIEASPQAYEALDLDHIYNQPYSRSHLETREFSPALQMNLFSITSHRGCGGGCAFCAIGQQEGKRIISRSHESILREIRELAKHRAWKGIITDIGGASGDMYGNDCHRKFCERISCLFPKECPGSSGVKRYIDLLRASRKTRGVRKVLLGSGLRYDRLLNAPELLEEIMVHHTGGFLRIAPEHTEGHVLELMKKPSFETLESFVRLFQRINRSLKRRIALAPYLILGHPGETLRDVSAMKARLRALGLRRTDVQIFTPTPGTLSTAQYVAGCDDSRRTVPVERNIRELAKRKEMLIRS
ncbi:MAG: YgiQ family radical SAM protein [Desulfatiglandales bacterium]